MLWNTIRFISTIQLALILRHRAYFTVFESKFNVEELLHIEHYRFKENMIIIYI